MTMFMGEKLVPRTSNITDMTLQTPAKVDTVHQLSYDFNYMSE